MTLPSLSLYIHLPWCLRRCPYCDFNAHALEPAKVPQQRYLDAIFTDAALAATEVEGREVQSIFIGGGTPSLFTPDAIADLLTQIGSIYQLASNCEITMEANPGTFEVDRFKAYHQAGVNRLSIGVQSLNDEKLKAIGRVHDSAQAIRAIEEVQKTFSNFNLDLMYALPGQTLSDLEEELEKILFFQAPHLSVYHLSIEPNTYFAKYPPTLPEDDLASQMLDLITEQTQKKAFDRYEVSAYAKEGFQCFHNKNYWQYGDYIGLGAGAHGKITRLDEKSGELLIQRKIKYREPWLYMENALKETPTAQEISVKKADRAFEFMLGALRLKSGVSKALFQERTGLSLEVIIPRLNRALEMGLLAADPHCLRASAHGFDFLNDLQALFLPD